jgi:NAD(P)-dependent dehydrogenase (short-subunit alcohol dehydrogenase family)
MYGREAGVRAPKLCACLLSPHHTTGAITTTATAVTLLQRQPELVGQTVVVIGGSAGVGLETARRARAEGADAILTVLVTAGGPHYGPLLEMDAAAGSSSRDRDGADHGIPRPMNAPVAVITGASQGIGAGPVAGYRRAGYAVVGVARSLASSDDDDYVAVAGDIADAETARRAVDQALGPFGRIDALINNASRTNRWSNSTAGTS